MIDLVGFYGISTIVEYLKPNLVFTDIKNMILNKFGKYFLRWSNSSISKHSI